MSLIALHGRLRAGQSLARAVLLAIGIAGAVIVRLLAMHALGGPHAGAHAAPVVAAPAAHQAGAAHTHHDAGAGAGSMTAATDSVAGQPCDCDGGHLDALAITCVLAILAMVLLLLRPGGALLLFALLPRAGLRPRTASARPPLRPPRSSPSASAARDGRGADRPLLRPVPTASAEGLHEPVAGRILMRIRHAGITALALTALLALSGCAGSGPDTMPGMGPGGGSSEVAGVNEADVMFTRMMIPHHEQAVEMSDLLLGKDDIDPDVADLAQQIKDAQQPEIDQMEEWLDEWDVDMPGPDGDHMGHGDGMMSDGDMEALEDAEGAEASKLFLEQMIQHHEGALEMAEVALENGESADVRALAEAIVESQTAEIELMREMLADM